MNINISKKYSTILPILHSDLWIGYDKSFITRPSAVILNSHQVKMPLGQQDWMTKTFEAVSWAAHNELVILTSTELNTWEFTLYAASRIMAQVLVLIPVNARLGTRFIKQQMLDVVDNFHLDATEFLLIPYESGKSSKELWLQRDQQLITWAKRIIPVSIKSGGKLKEMLSENEILPKIDRRFQVDYNPDAYKPEIPDKINLSSEIESLEKNNCDYLVHWTRSTSNPWPDQSAFDYYNELYENAAYPNTAFNTLRHILDKNIIFASNWRMPLNKSMVSFSDLLPQEMLSRMTWRRRYCRYSFEPYGIGINKETLLKKGANKILYGSAEEKKTVSINKRIYFQILSEKADWFKESEYRLKGDLNLQEIDKQDMIIFVLTCEEKTIIENNYGIECICFT